MESREEPTFKGETEKSEFGRKTSGETGLKETKQGRGGWGENFQALWREQR